jgi:plastocyanin
LAAVFLLALAGCGGSQPSGNSVPPTQPPLINPSTAVVKMVARGGGYAFQPAVLTVDVGARVVFRNLTQAPHTVTATNGHPDLNSGAAGPIRPGHSWTFVFVKPGVYTYRSTLDQGMTGRVIVTG